MSRTVEQKRAAFALNFVTAFQGSKAELATHIQKTPIRILQNGLGQALAFLLANNEGKTGDKRKSSGTLYDHLQKWLCEAGQPCRVYDGTAGDLMKQVVEGNRAQYLRAQQEALALFTWLKKFSDAYLDKDPA